MTTRLNNDYAPARAVPYLGIYTRPDPEATVHVRWVEYEDATQPATVGLNIYGGLTPDELQCLKNAQRHANQDPSRLAALLTDFKFALILPLASSSYASQMEGILRAARRRDSISYYAERHNVSLAEAEQLVDRAQSPMRLTCPVLPDDYVKPHLR